mmetsp:Transcript_3454/g.8740  ORF Transcript_3454/g.8740 Transcript_3454/m.8740 type:complete len:267 (-) Transcript_3454:905-1705(-)
MIVHVDNRSLLLRLRRAVCFDDLPIPVDRHCRHVRGSAPQQCFKVHVRDGVEDLDAADGAQGLALRLSCDSRKCLPSRKIEALHVLTLGALRGRGDAREQQRALERDLVLLDDDAPVLVVAPPAAPLRDWLGAITRRGAWWGAPAHRSVRRVRRRRGRVLKPRRGALGRAHAPLTAPSRILLTRRAVAGGAERTVLAVRVHPLLCVELLEPDRLDCWALALSLPHRHGDNRIGSAALPHHAALARPIARPCVGLALFPSAPAFERV